MIKLLAAIIYAVSMLAGVQAFSGEALSQYPLHVAAEHNDVSAIGRLLSAGVEIEARDASSSTALLVARSSRPGPM